ncbi:hypothetical protein IAR55_006979 [Kwoniella newhampshirensis]|uniref:PWWP domain-containing protein n=1 Tax=Kwoniella newhampshirensis TaxID=1651941 RepID=A0AAW0YHF6_9TREE
MPQAKTRARARAPRPSSPASTSSLSSLEDSPSPPPLRKKTAVTTRIKASKVPPVKAVSTPKKSPVKAHIPPSKPPSQSLGFPDFSSSFTIARPMMESVTRETRETTIRLNATASSSSITITSSRTLVGSIKDATEERTASSRKAGNGKGKNERGKGETSIPPTLPRGKRKTSDGTDLDSDGGADINFPEFQTRIISPTVRPSSPKRRRSPSLLELRLGYGSDSEDGEDDQTLDNLLAILERPDDAPPPSEKKKEKRFRPTPMQDGISLGDFVYVKNKNNWWIGKILRYDPADNHADQRKGWDFYTVVDRFGEILKRKKSSDIITKYDERIADCILGDFKIQKREFANDAGFRAPTPAPETDILQPSTSDDFGRLDRVEQLRLIRPHLLRIISETYEPARWRIDLFFGGNTNRRKLASKSKHGDITEDEVAQVIIPELKRWAMRGLRWHGQQDANTRPDELPRPSGSDRYNALKPSELEGFIQDVLVPEAIMQLCVRSYSREDLINGQNQDNEDEDELMVLTVPDAEEDIRVGDPRNSSVRSQGPAPTSAQPEGDVPVSEAEVYQAASALVTSLYKRNTYKMWAGQEAILRRAREAMRERLGLPDEKMGEYELKKWKEQKLGMEEGWAGARMRHKKVLKE